MEQSQTTKHTPEPWQTGKDNRYFNKLGATTVFPWDIVALEAKSVLPLRIGQVAMYQGGAGIANAQRIVACVNGCKDLNPDGYRDCVDKLAELVRVLDLTGFGWVAGWEGGHLEALAFAHAALDQAKKGV